jgi:Family of unknown function (DUF6011)
VNQDLQDYPALNALLRMAEASAKNAEITKRPCWAPALVLEGELLDLCRELKWLKQEDKPVARLWARWLDPRHYGIKCVGFDLITGVTRKGQKLVEAMSGRVLYSSKFIAYDGKWNLGPNWPSRWWRSEVEEGGSPLSEAERADRRTAAASRRATELAFGRLAEFTGRPHVQMQAGGRLTGNCACCGKGLRDKLSLERGVGPECWSGFDKESQLDFGRMVAETRVSLTNEVQPLVRDWMVGLV